MTRARRALATRYGKSKVTLLRHNPLRHLGLLGRYALRQHFWPLLLGFSLIVFVLIIDVILQMMDQVLSKGLEFSLALELFVFNLGWIIALAVPMAVLVAVLMAFGRLAASNQILALKSSGISFMRLLWPVLAAAAVLTVLMILFNDRVLPDWNHRARNIASSLKRRKAALVLKEKEGVFIRDLGPYNLLIRKVDELTNTLGDITVYDSGSPGYPTTLHAGSGELEIFEDGRYIRLTLYEGESHRVEADDPERYMRASFGRQIVHIEDPDRAFSEYRSSYRSDREMDIAAMGRAVDEYRRERDRAVAFMDSSVEAFLEAVRRAPAAGTSWDSLRASDLKEKSSSLAGQLKKRLRHNRNRERRANAYLVEIHKKFSIAVACFVFALLGAPLGVLVRARGAALSVAVSLIFFFAYWAFLIGGEQLADRGYVEPALAMWAPNILFGLVGALLLRTIALDRPLKLRVFRQ